MKLAKDLFYGPGNYYLDLGRVAAGIVLVVIVFVVAWNTRFGAISLAELGALITGGLGPCAAWVAAKTYERRQEAKSTAEAVVAKAVAEAPPPSDEPTQVEVVNTPANPVPVEGDR
jgi:hypothetical protein